MSSPSSPSHDFIGTLEKQYETKRKATIAELKEQVQDLLNQVEVIRKRKANMKEVTRPKHVSTSLPGFTPENWVTDVQENP
ncbi:hypothetical protein AMTR_s00027p00202180 [Amborella trichopoda]|uniref:Uncharacterized protein n=1 Tax=Amborella trichopoda TaxID=13333 RepID=W1PSU4_AMBTC|nr:hypothetical protein AMTR_s00027p00202180 [Amborella trichopoda]